jgi:hypothetical protein
MRPSEVYINGLNQFRKNNGWGMLPCEEKTYAFFNRVNHYTKVRNVLEFGTCLGGSAAMMLDTYPNAYIHTFDPGQWTLKDSTYGLYDTTNKKRGWYVGDVSPYSFVSLIYGDRFNQYPRKSQWAADLITDITFDFAFVDGSHDTPDVIVDMDLVLNHFKVPYIAVDNMVDKKIVEGVYKYSDQLEEVDVLNYTQVHPTKDKVHNDKVILFKRVE